MVSPEHGPEAIDGTLTRNAPLARARLGSRRSSGGARGLPVRGRRRDRALRWKERQPASPGARLLLRRRSAQRANRRDAGPRPPGRVARDGERSRGAARRSAEDRGHAPGLQSRAAESLARLVSGDRLAGPVPATARGARAARGRGTAVRAVPRAEGAGADRPAPRARLPAPELPRARDPGPGGLALPGAWRRSLLGPLCPCSGPVGLPRAGRSRRAVAGRPALRDR